MRRSSRGSPAAVDAISGARTTSDAGPLPTTEQPPIGWALPGGTALAVRVDHDPFPVR
ncbi:MAG: hypothetical protein ACREQ5_40350 [Candidatus Dormibacteria bacterium]